MPSRTKSSQPLKGLRLVVTRAQDDALATRLAMLGATVQHVPAIERRALPHASVAWDDATAILLTSPATLRFLRTHALPPNKCIVSCVGQRTALAAQDIGFTPTIVGDGLAVSCIEEMALDGQDLVYFPGPARPLPATLQALNMTGACIRHIPVYETTSPTDLPAQLQVLTPFDLLIFASPSAVDHWRAAGGPFGRVVSIGPTTTETAHSQGFSEVLNAAVPTIDGVVQRITTWADAN